MKSLTAIDNLKMIKLYNRSTLLLWIIKVQTSYSYSIIKVKESMRFIRQGCLFYVSVDFGTLFQINPYVILKCVFENPIFFQH